VREIGVLDSRRNGILIGLGAGLAAGLATGLLLSQDGGNLRGLAVMMSTAAAVASGSASVPPSMPRTGTITLCTAHLPGWCASHQSSRRRKDAVPWLRSVGQRGLE